MKTILPAERPADREVNVSCTSGPGLVTIEGSGPGIMWRRSFDPAEAVKLWRCLMGECSTVHATDADGVPVRLWSHVPPGSDDVWDLGNDGERLCQLDADQALALAWAIKKCCGIALCASMPVAERPCDKEPKPLRVWVLAARRVLTGDCCETGVDLIGGHERVFLTEAAALDALRGFLHPLVNEANSETFWANSTTTVNDVLDVVMEPGKRSGWLYNGDKQSFEVTLRQIEVEHGA